MATMIAFPRAVPTGRESAAAQRQRSLVLPMPASPPTAAAAAAAIDLGALSALSSIGTIIGGAAGAAAAAPWAWAPLVLAPATATAPSMSSPTAAAPSPYAPMPYALPYALPYPQHYAPPNVRPFAPAFLEHQGYAPTPPYSLPAPQSAVHYQVVPWELPKPPATTSVAAGGGPRPPPVAPNRAPAAAQGEEQESERLERLPNVDDVPASLLEGPSTEHVRLVSLGCMCGTKLSFKSLGRGAETLPFDWTRTRLRGILHFMRSDFEGFFDYATVAAGLGNMTMYRSRYHSFWHDNPDDPSMREKYARRIDRFHSIDATAQPVLFVRAVASTHEVELAEEFVGELRQRFGEGAHLLMILDFQKRLQGPALVRGVQGNVLLYFHRSEDRRPAASPYMLPVVAGLRWAAGQPLDGVTDFASIREAMCYVDQTDWGYTAHGDVAAFEDPLPAPAPADTGAGAGAVAAAAATAAARQWPCSAFGGLTAATPPVAPLAAATGVAGAAIGARGGGVGAGAC